METIENDHLKVKVKPIGAELSSIFLKSNGIEYLWQGDPSIWSSQAPVLFPIIGGLKEGTYKYKEETYSLPKHGFIRYNKELEINQISKTKVTYALGSSAKTLKLYPFKFHFLISYELIDNKIKVTHEIKNNGDEMLLFSLGGHPAFNCPLRPDEDYQDYYIQMDKPITLESYALNEEGLIKNEKTSKFDHGRIPLTQDLFDTDALIFKNIQSKGAALFHKEKGGILRMDFEDFSDLGIWAKPKAPFVCIEPWLGYADQEDSSQQFEEKAGIKTLLPDKMHTSTYTITIF